MVQIPYLARDSELALSKLRMTALSRQQKLLSVTVILVSFLMSCAPLISTNPQVHGRSYWSVLDIALAVSDGRLPAESIPVTLGIVYGLFAIYLGAIIIPYSEKLLFVISVAGMTLSLGSLEWDRNSFGMMFFGDIHFVRQSPASVGFGLLATLLFAAMTALFCILRGSANSKKR